MHILLVEDDPMIGEAVREALTDEGYDVLWAKSGWEAGGMLAAGTSSEYRRADIGSLKPATSIATEKSIFRNEKREAMPLSSRSCSTESL